MKLNGRGCIACLLASLIALFPWSIRAEVSASTPDPSTSLFVVGIIEDPDPIPHLLWEPVRDVDPALFLNVSGAARGDGPPDAAYDLTTCRPLVVWAYHAGDRDVAFAEWNNGSWENTAFLAATAADELDPRIFVEPDGTAHVVWWIPGAPSRMYRLLRPAGSAVWGSAELLGINGQPGRRPSVALHEGKVLVAYERDGAQGKEVAVAERTGPGEYSTKTVVASNQGLSVLEPVMHVENGRLWVDWKHSSDRIAYSVYEGGTWSPPQLVAWDEPSWLGEQAARGLARSAALAQ